MRFVPAGMLGRYLIESKFMLECNWVSFRPDGSEYGRPLSVPVRMIAAKSSERKNIALSVVGIRMRDDPRRLSESSY